MRSCRRTDVSKDIADAHQTPDQSSRLYRLLISQLLLDERHEQLREPVISTARPAYSLSRVLLLALIELQRFDEAGRIDRVALRHLHEPESID
jgi:hypothetical protein